MKKILVIILLLLCFNIGGMGYHEGELEAEDFMWEVERARREDLRQREARLEPNPFIKAVILNQLVTVQKMLAQNPDYANTRNSRGTSALVLAIQKEQDEIVKALLANQAIPDNEALRSAVLRGSLPIVKLLVEAGADPKSVDVNKQTPERLARSLNLIEIADYLSKASQINTKL